MKLTQSALLLAMLAALPAARADVYYSWSETGSSFGSGAGMLAINPVPLGTDAGISEFTGTGWDYTITSITGIMNGIVLTGIDPTLSPNRLNINTSTGKGTVLGALMSFTTSSGGGLFPVVTSYQFIDLPVSQTVETVSDGDSSFDLSGDNFSFTLLTPEPSQMASGLVLAGLGGASLLLRGLRNRK